MKRPLIVLKLGGSAITLKDDSVARTREDVLSRLAGEIANALKKKDISLVVIHGAGPFGHVPAKEHDLANGLKDASQLAGFSKTHLSMQKLNTAVVEALVEKGVNAIEFQPSCCSMMEDGKLVSFPLGELSRLMGMGMVPVLYGDVLMDKSTGLGILSGDHIVAYLAAELAADRVLLASDVPGIYDRDPKKNGDAKLIKEVTQENLSRIRATASTKGVDVTGGMDRKLRELLTLAQLGIESEIIHAFTPGLLERAILGETGLGSMVKRPSP